MIKKLQARDAKVFRFRYFLIVSKLKGLATEKFGIRNLDIVSVFVISKWQSHVSRSTS